MSVGITRMLMPCAVYVCVINFANVAKYVHQMILFSRRIMFFYAIVQIFHGSVRADPGGARCGVIRPRKRAGIMLSNTLLHSFVFIWVCSRCPNVHFISTNQALPFTSVTPRIQIAIGSGSSVWVVSVHGGVFCECVVVLDGSSRKYVTPSVTVIFLDSEASCSGTRLVIGHARCMFVCVYVCMHACIICIRIRMSSVANQQPHLTIVTHLFILTGNVAATQSTVATTGHTRVCVCACMRVAYWACRCHLYESRVFMSCVTSLSERDCVCFYAASGADGVSVLGSQHVRWRGCDFVF